MWWFIKHVIWWWIKYAWWSEYHRHCDVFFNSKTGYLVCVTDDRKFLYDDDPAA